MEPEAISTLLNVHIEFLVKSLTGVAAVGTLAMALVQILKATPIRGWYFKLQLQNFLRDRQVKQADIAEYERMICNHVAGSKRAFYAQELSAIIQGLGSIKNIAIAWPGNNKSSSFLSLFDANTVKKLNHPTIPPKDPKQLTSYLNLLATANIDGFNVSVKRKWTLIQQSAAIVFSMAIIIAIGPFESFLAMLVYGLLGGIIAPFAHDIIKKIKPV